MQINDEHTNKTYRKEKILQFGEGNFLRGFVEWYVQRVDNSGIFNGNVVITQPRKTGRIENLTKQDCLYTVILRGRNNGQIVDSSELINCVSRGINPYKDYSSLIDVACSDDLKIIISNTTEAGIEYVPDEEYSDIPNVSYPGKLADLLYKRFLLDKDGLLILPVELIEDNGEELRKCVLKYADDWDFGKDFTDYINNECHFCSTLVDRIVTGFPKSNYNSFVERLGYEDAQMVVAEPFNSWIIQGDKNLSTIFPINKISPNVIWTDSISEYRNRKVRILNGAHTISVLTAYLCGFNIVREMMQDKSFDKYIRHALFNEIIPTIKLPKKETENFALSVLERFDNPFIDHKLLDISLNSAPKFKVRCLPSILDYIKMNSDAPKAMSFGFAALIAFYDGEFKGDKYIGQRNGNEYVINDSLCVCQKFYRAYKTDDVVKCVLSDSDLWEQDLMKYNSLYLCVKKYFNDIKQNGIQNAITHLLTDI